MWHGRAVLMRVRVWERVLFLFLALGPQLLAGPFGVCPCAGVRVFFSFRIPFLSRYDSVVSPAGNAFSPDV